MFRIRLLAVVPVVFGLTLAFALHPAAGASHTQSRDEPRIHSSIATKPQLDLEGYAYYCVSDPYAACTGHSPNTNFTRCGPTTAGCAEAWADMDGPNNGRQATGSPQNLKVGCGKSFQDNFGITHFEYATLEAGAGHLGSKLNGAGVIFSQASDATDSGKDLLALLTANASGTSYKATGEAYATSVVVKSEKNGRQGVVTINNGSGDEGTEHVVSGGFIITFTGVVDETPGSGYESGGVTESYNAHGTVSCTIDAGNVLGNGGPYGASGPPDFDAELDYS